VQCWQVHGGGNNIDDRLSFVLWLCLQEWITVLLFVDLTANALAKAKVHDLNGFRFRRFDTANAICGLVYMLSQFCIFAVSVALLPAVLLGISTTSGTRFISDGSMLLLVLLSPLIAILGMYGVSRIQVITCKVTKSHPMLYMIFRPTVFFCLFGLVTWSSTKLVSIRERIFELVFCPDIRFACRERGEAATNNMRPLLLLLFASR